VQPVTGARQRLDATGYTGVTGCHVWKMSKYLLLCCVIGCHGSYGNITNLMTLH